MRPSVVFAGGLLALASLPAVAQPMPPPLAYVQPVPATVVQSVQQRLRDANVYSGRIDGVWGIDSENSLRRYQQAHQLQVTGQLNQATMATLGLDSNTLLAASPPPSPPLDPGRLSQASVRALQARLGTLGFYSGAVDGNWGPGTETAVVNFQRARGLQTDGQLGPSTVTALGMAPDLLAYR